MLFVACWYLSHHQFRRHLRENVRQGWPNTDKLGVRGNVMSLRIRKPGNRLLLRLGHSRIENPELHRGDVGCVLWRGTGRVQVGYWNFDVYGAHLVRAGVFWKCRDRAQSRQIGGKFRRCREFRGRHCDSVRNAPRESLTIVCVLVIDSTVYSTEIECGLYLRSTNRYGLSRAVVQIQRSL